MMKEIAALFDMIGSLMKVIAGIMILMQPLSIFIQKGVFTMQLFEYGMMKEKMQRMMKYTSI